MNVGIIGLGYVGLTLGVVASLKKFNVYGLELDDDIKKQLRNKQAHFYEPSLNALLANHIDRNFFIVDAFEARQNIETFIITVGTPLLTGTKEPNLEHIRSAIEQLRGVYTGDQLVILRSTISIGTTSTVVLPYLANLCGKNASELPVAFCPERTIEGKALLELQELPQVIGANNRMAMTLAENFFRELTPTIIKVETLEAAELVKLFNNTYRDIHFALGNVFNEISQSFGINGVKLIKAANIGYERSNIPSPGFVGGPCLEKDPYILTHNMEDTEGKRFVVSARKYNESLEKKILKWVNTICRVNNLKRKLCISGLAFKGVPDTSDLRGSNGVNIARSLHQEGFELTLHDFVAYRKEVEGLKIGTYSDDIYRASEGHSLLLILNNNSRYTKLEIERLVKSLAEGATVFDAWGVIDYLEDPHETKIKVVTLGSLDI